MLTLFLFQKGQGFFPSLPIAARLPRSWRGDILNPCRGDALAWLVFFRKAKGQREIKSTLTFTASRRACRPTAVFPIQLAQSHTRPASREACRRAAVKPRPSCMSPYAPARLWRAAWGQGALPLARGLLPSGGKPATKLLSSERSARIARSPGSRGTAPCASREACRRAAVNLRSSCFPPSALRA